MNGKNSSFTIKTQGHGYALAVKDDVSETIVAGQKVGNDVVFFTKHGIFSFNPGNGSWSLGGKHPLMTQLEELL